jgi:hypothetical protein
MTTDADGYLDEAAPRRGIAVGRIRELSLGTKLVLVCGTLLFFSLFLTWQNLEIDFGPAGTATQMLDGWDTLGLMIGLLTLGLLALVVVVWASDVDVSPDVPWELIALALASSVLALVVLKNLTDRNSAWASYLGMVLAGLVVTGAFLEWYGYEPRRHWVGRRR